MSSLQLRLIKLISGVVVGVGLFAAPFAYASTSVSIQSLSPSTNVAVGTTVSFSVVASGFTNPTFTLVDSASGSSINSGSINASGGFSWTPTSNDIGTHTLTITVGDSLGDSAVTTETLVVSTAPSVSIQSLSPSSSITAGQTVSFVAVAAGFSNPSYTVTDTLNGSSVSSSNINSSGNFSWTPGSNQNGTHTLTITVSDSSGHTATAIETITVSSSPTVVIQSLSPGTSVNVGQTMTLYASATGFSNPSYYLSDSFGGTTLSNSNINSSGNVSWSPTSNDTGSHTITVTVQDSSGHSATATEVITVGGSGASIQGLSPGNTVVVGNQVTFTVAASGFSNPVFTTQDAFSGSSASNANLNSAGYFSWTPTNNDVGTHTFTIYVNDSLGHTGNVTLSIVVQTPNIAIVSLNPGSIVLPNSNLTFNLTSAGLTNPTYTLSDSFSGTSITNANISTSGYFTWTPATNQSGSHVITVYATDSAGHSANTSITIDVNSGVSLALTAVSPNSSVTSGTAVTFSAYAYGFTSPTYTLQDSFAGSTLTSSDITPAGYFNWTPSSIDAGTHVITVTGTDIYGHVATAQATISVTASSVLSTSATTGNSSGYTFTDSLSSGVTSNEVTELQSLLSKLGFFSGPVSGYYGPLTTAAVERYQQAHGIEALGIVGPITLAALNGGSSATNTSSGGDGYVFSDFIGFGSTGTLVTELQKRLTVLKVYSGDITGYFGPLTQQAVRQLQRDHGVSAVGYVGPSTRAVLNN